MLKKILVDQNKKDGKRLVLALDAAGLEVRAAFWFFDGESGNWRLVIHFPEVDHTNLNQLYGLVQRIMWPMKPALSFGLSDVALASSFNMLLGAVGQIRHTRPDEIVDLHIDGPLFPDGVQIDGLHIYRMAM